MASTILIPREVGSRAAANVCSKHPGLIGMRYMTRFSISIVGWALGFALVVWARGAQATPHPTVTELRTEALMSLIMSDAPIGAPCAGGDECSSGLCVSDPAYPDSYCSSLCSPQSADCPATFQCVPSDSQAFCLRPAPAQELCDQCTINDHCVAGPCVAVPQRNGGQPFCTQACDPTTSNSCPTGYQCEVTVQQNTQVAVCVPTSGVCTAQGRGGHLEPCFSNNSCKPGHGCFEYWPGLSFCYALCDIGSVGLSCGSARSRCTEVPGRSGVAACYEIARANEPCAPEQCDAQSLCAFDENLGLETATCYQVCPGGSDGECPANFDCSDEGLVAPICLPLDGFKALGEGCASDSECNSRTCRVIGTNRLCTRVCTTTNDDCGPGLLCVPESNSTNGICWPRSFLDTPPPTTPPPSFCACDSTQGCDVNCDCDPECAGGCRDIRIQPLEPRGLMMRLLGFVVLLGAWVGIRRWLRKQLV